MPARISRLLSARIVRALPLAAFGLRAALARARAAASASLRVGVGRPLPPVLVLPGAATASGSGAVLVRRNNAGLVRVGVEWWVPGYPAGTAPPGNLLG